MTTGASNTLVIFRNCRMVLVLHPQMARKEMDCGVQSADEQPSVIWLP